MSTERGTGNGPDAQFTRPVCKDDLRSYVEITGKVSALAVLGVRSSRKAVPRTSCWWLPCVRPSANDHVAGEVDQISLRSLFAYGCYQNCQNVDALLSTWLQIPAGVALRAAARCALLRTSCFLELRLPGGLCPADDGHPEAERVYQVKSCLYDDGGGVHVPALMVLQVAGQPRPAATPQTLSGGPRQPVDMGLLHTSSALRSHRMLDTAATASMPAGAATLAVEGAACCVTLLQFPTGLVLFQNPRSKAYLGDVVGKTLGQMFLRQLLSEWTCSDALSDPLDAVMQSLESGKEFEAIVQVPASLADLERLERRARKDSGGMSTVRHLNLQRCTSVFTDLLTTDEDGQDVLDSEDRLLLEALTQQTSPRGNDREGGARAGGGASAAGGAPASSGHASGDCAGRRRRVRRSISLHEVDGAAPVRPATNLTEALHKPVHILLRSRRAETTQRPPLWATQGRAASFSVPASSAGGRSGTLGGGRTATAQQAPDVSYRGSVSGRSRLALAVSSGLYHSGELSCTQRVRTEPQFQATATATTAAAVTAAATAAATATATGNAGGTSEFLAMPRRSAYTEGVRDVGLLGPVLQRQHQQQHAQAQHSQHAQQGDGQLQDQPRPLQDARQEVQVQVRTSDDSCSPTLPACPEIGLATGSGGAAVRAAIEAGSAAGALAAPVAGTVAARGRATGHGETPRSSSNSAVHTPPANALPGAPGLVPAGALHPGTPTVAMMAMGSSGASSGQEALPDDVWGLVRDLGLSLSGGPSISGGATHAPSSEGVPGASAPPTAGPTVPVLAGLARTAPTAGDARCPTLPSALFLTRRTSRQAFQRTSAGQVNVVPASTVAAARLSSPPGEHLLGRRGASLLGRAPGSGGTLTHSSPSDILVTEQELKIVGTNSASTDLRSGTASLAGPAGLGGNSCSISLNTSRPAGLDSLTLATLSVIRQTNASVMGRDDSAAQHQQQQLLPQPHPPHDQQQQDQPCQSQHPPPPPPPPQQQQQKPPPQQRQASRSSQERTPSIRFSGEVVPVLEFASFAARQANSIQRTFSTPAPLDAGNLALAMREGSLQAQGLPAVSDIAAEQAAAAAAAAADAEAGAEVEAAPAEAVLPAAGPLPPPCGSAVALSPAAGSSSTFLSARCSNSDGSGCGEQGGEEAAAAEAGAPNWSARDPRVTSQGRARPAASTSPVGLRGPSAVPSGAASEVEAHLLLLGALHDDVNAAEGGAAGMSTSVSMRTGDCTGPHSGFTTATGAATTSTLAIQPAWPDLPSVACSPFRSSCAWASAAAPVKAAAVVATEIARAAGPAPAPATAPPPEARVAVHGGPTGAPSAPNPRQLMKVVTASQPTPAAAPLPSPSEACLPTAFASLPTSPMAVFPSPSLTRGRRGSLDMTARLDAAGAVSSSNTSTRGAGYNRGLRLMALDALHVSSTLLRGGQLLSAAPAVVSTGTGQRSYVDAISECRDAVAAAASAPRPQPLSTPAVDRMAVGTAGRRVPSMSSRSATGMVGMATAGAAAAAVQGAARPAAVALVPTAAAEMDATLTAARDMTTTVDGTFPVGSMPSMTTAHILDSRRRATVDGLHGEGATGTLTNSHDSTLQREPSLGAPSASSNARGGAQRSRRSVPLRSQTTARRLTQLLNSFSSQAPYAGGAGAGAAAGASIAGAAADGSRHRQGPGNPTTTEIVGCNDATSVAAAAAAAAAATTTVGTRGSKSIRPMSAVVASVAQGRTSSAAVGPTGGGMPRRVWHKIIVHGFASSAPAMTPAGPVTTMNAAAAHPSPLGRDCMLSTGGTLATAATGVIAATAGGAVTGPGSRAGGQGSRLATATGVAGGANNGARSPMTLTVTQIDVTEQVEAQAGLTRLLEQEHKVLEGIFPRHVIEYMTLQEGAKTCPAASTGAAGSSLLTLAPGSMERMASLATWHPGVTILFADCVGFTSMCHAATPLAVMAFLNQLYSRFDDMIDIYKVYKVETIGDCYMVAGGLVAYDDDGYKSVISGSEDPLHAVRVMEFAKAMLRASRDIRMPDTGEPVQMRIGLHSGPVTSGVVGERMPRFCVFGDTVNTASRMESTCRPGCIHVSAATQARLPNEAWRDRGMTVVKGKGEMRTYEWAGDVDAAVDGGQLQRVIGLYL